MKDMESNPDFTCMQYKKIQDEKAAVQQEEIKDLVKKVIEKAKDDSPVSTIPKVPPVIKKVWHEAKSEQGHTYYWNIETNGASSREKLYYLIVYIT